MIGNQEAKKTDGSIAITPSKEPDSSYPIFMNYLENIPQSIATAHKMPDLLEIAISA